MPTKFIYILFFISFSAFAKIPVSLTISGGVSMGAYEAGYLFYSLQHFGKSPDAYELVELTGASAGAINAFLTLFSICGPGPLDSPEESLFWKTWIPIGFNELRGSPRGRKPSGLFSMEALENAAEAIEPLWFQGFKKSCDVVLGITTTLVKPEQISIGDSIQAVHQEEPFVLRIQGRGFGRPPQISNYVDSTKTIPQALLDLTDDPKEQFRAVRNLLFASAAFPGAFPPQKLKFFKGPSHKPQEAYFIDGGVYDNEPLRLALRLAARGYEKGWREAPNSQAHFPPKAMLFRALDVSAKTYPSDFPSEKSELTTEQDPISTYLTRFASHFVMTTRSQQLYSVLNDFPELEKSIQSSQNHYPPMSETSLGFTGFLDRGFREYDFYLGMADAQKRYHSNDPQKIGATWERFQCHLKTFQDLSVPTPCLKFPSDVILAQLSLDELYSTCSRFSPEQVTSSYSSPECLKAAQGLSPPKLISSKEPIRWKRDINENDTLHQLNSLNQYHYPFQVLQEDSSSTDVFTALRSQMLGAFRDLSDQQPARERLGFHLAGEPAFNLIAYAPPVTQYSYLLGELWEASVSRIAFSWLRPTATLSVFRPQDLFSSGWGRFSLSPLAGVEVETRFLSNAWVQPRLGIRGGYQFSPGDQWGSASCKDPLGCSRWLWEPTLSLTVYNRFKIQLVERILPATVNQKTEWNSVIQLGVALGS